MAIKPKVVYPHVSNVKDVDAQQSLRLLWERVFGLDSRLNTSEASIGTLQSTVGEHTASLTDLGNQITNASAPAGARVGSGPAGTSVGTPAPGSGTTTPSTHPDHTDVVVQAKADLVAALIDITGSCGAFQIVKLVTWRLKSSEPDIGLIAKGGTNCDGYSTDAVMYKDGTVWDMLSDAGGANGPQWNQDPDRPATDWRDPVPPAI